MKITKLDLKHMGFVDNDNYYLCRVGSNVFVSHIVYAKLDPNSKAHTPCVDDVKGKKIYSIYEVDEIHMVEL